MKKFLIKDSVIVQAYELPRVMFSTGEEECSDLVEAYRANEPIGQKVMIHLDYLTPLSSIYNVRRVG